MQHSVILMTAWVLVMTGCSTTRDEGSKTKPQVQVIGHGTKPGGRWAGVGVKVPFPTPAGTSTGSKAEESKPDP